MASIHFNQNQTKLTDFGHVAQISNSEKEKEMLFAIHNATIILGNYIE
jgi:hypothetical protein